MILALDIGGANIKRLLFGGSEVISEVHEFSFWKRKGEFEGFLSGLSEDCDGVGITMTAELCDCFESKRSGVEFIVSSCERIFPSPLYLTTEGKLLLKEEIKDWKGLAAANWLASVHFLEREFGKGILLDIGSTTTDIVPFGIPAEVGRTDLERLEKGNLIYTGVLRTPVPSLISKVPFRGMLTRIAPEYFAVTADVYTILGGSRYACETPDGKGKGRDDAMRRMAKLLCSDVEELGEGAIMEMCEHVRGAQIEVIEGALRRISDDSKVKEVYVGGIGKDLGLMACEKAEFDSVDLEEVTGAYDNLPCLGLACMVGEYKKNKGRRNAT